MTSESLPSRPPSRASAGLALDGEVIPPTIRVVNPDPEAPAAPVAATKEPRRMRLSTALLAGALLATLSGAGALEGYRWHLRSVRQAAGPSAASVALAKLGKDVGDLKTSVAATRQDDGVKALKKTIDQLRAELDGVRSANAATTAQLTAKLDKPPPAPSGPALNDVVARLDKLDRDPKLGDISARLDRIERQISSPTPTGSIAAKPKADQSVVAQATSAPVSAAAGNKPKAVVLDNWILRDVYSGIALVEGRNGNVREVVPGEVLPGAGEVRSIERHGRRWIVMTSRGIIDTETW